VYAEWFSDFEIVEWNAFFEYEDFIKASEE
jgi:hypothetical protein